MGRKKAKSDLGTFHKAAVESGLTYATAQIQETCRMIGKVRAPGSHHYKRKKESGR